MLLLSKVDVNLLQPAKETLEENTVSLRLDGGVDSLQRAYHDNISESAYSNTIELSNSEYFSYHFSLDYSVLTLYSMGSIANGKTINIHLPNPSMNKQHTFTIQEIDENLSINIILEDGVVLLMDLPLDFLCSREGSLDESWFDILYPYDFTVRIPHLLRTVSRDFSIVFLDDGGLLGLRKTEDCNLEPILFNDNSYLQSITQIFSRRHPNKCEKAICASTYAQKFLIVLTQNCHLKIWDLTNFSLIQDMDLTKGNYFESSDNRTYESPGEYMTLFGDYLTIYLPFGNGIFQIGELRVDSRGKLLFNQKSLVPTNLSSSSIWSLVDILMVKPMDLNLCSSYLNMVVLWKSGCISKVQILSFSDNEMQIHEWIEATNRSLSDIEAEQDLRVNGDAEEAYINLKTRYSPDIFELAQKILGENNIVVSVDQPQTEEYLANLETVLRDLKSNRDEVSSLTIYRNEIIVTNCLHKYNHSAFIINSTLENIYYNIHSEYNEDDLTRFLKSLHGFSSTLSKQVLSNVSEKLIEIVSGGVPESQTMNEKFTNIFKTCLERNFEVSNLKLLFDELSALDIIPLLNDFIDHHLRDLKSRVQDFIDSVAVDAFSSVVTMESLYQLITIQHHFVLQVLLAFGFLDFEYSIFAKQLDALLELHFKQSLVLSLYQIDKSLLATEIFAKTTKYGSGVRLGSYSQWRSYLDYVLSHIYESSLTLNPFFMKFFDVYVCRYKVIDEQQKLMSKLLLKKVGWPFYIRDNKTEEFMLAMMLFVSEQHGQAYEFFQLHDYTEAISDSLPECVKNLADGTSHSIWTPLISSFKVPYRHSSYFFELSKLFFQGSNIEYAFKCIKKSIEYSMKNVEIKEPQSFKQTQLELYLDLLFHFNMFAEALDVLRFSHDVLSEHIREKYFRTMLESTRQSAPFLATVLRSCHSHSDSIYLPVTDYRIIDKILVSHVSENDWKSLKKLYSFRIVNNHERAAAELLYEYLKSNCDDVETKRKCYLIIVNVLSTFDNMRDRWLLYGNDVLTSADLQKELEAL